jgi:hypothetical protein
LLLLAVVEVEVVEIDHLVVVVLVVIAQALEHLAVVVLQKVHRLYFYQVTT